MDVSESPPNSSHRQHQRNHRYHPHPQNTYAAAPYQTNPDTDTTNAPITPDTSPSSITHLRAVSRMVNSDDSEGDNSTPTQSTISKSSSSSSMRSLVAQGEILSRGGPCRTSLSVKPVSASTTVNVSLPPSSDPGPSTSNTSGRRRHHQDMSQTRSQQSLVSVSGGFNPLLISRSGGNSSDLDSNNGSKSTHESESSNGPDSSSCYPSPTSPDPPSAVAAATLERIQKRITQGQSQLVQYTDMIHKHETDLTGYVTLQSCQQKRREALENEIEVLESAIRQGPSTPVSPLSTLKSTLTERRDLLRNVQRSIDQVQQKIHSTNSQIRHLQRTFVLPIETCLQEDQGELGRLLQLQMPQSQREREQQQHQQ
ncbi:hypothetical protein KI688_009256 [Linnemannia hyalina]|uniref:Uncharacterized protein n=1 Tax=Linnemannia hyalina TaxID=64524 RepID=A0A9P7Y270_9FUNG|nr:hypothetical protein KI688_009256 [Linnemannia hyalina]